MRETDTHIYFWSGPFSNWDLCEFEYEGHKFFNTEQAFMWCKAMHFLDEDSAKEILKTPNPRQNKKLGRSVNGFIKEEWDSICSHYMVLVNLAKFSQIKYYQEEMKRSCDKTIVEASPNDRIWSVGLHWKDDAVLDEKNWLGQNLLGIALMRVREILIERKII